MARSFTEPHSFILFLYAFSFLCLSLLVVLLLIFFMPPKWLFSFIYLLHVHHIILIYTYIYMYRSFFSFHQAALRIDDIKPNVGLPMVVPFAPLPFSKIKRKKWRQKECVCAHVSVYAERRTNGTSWSHLFDAKNETYTLLSSFLFFSLLFFFYVLAGSRITFYERNVSLSHFVKVCFLPPFC